MGVGVSAGGWYDPRAVKMLELPADTAHVFTLSADDCRDPELLCAYEALMTPEERQRRDRFVFEKGRREYLLTRALVRTTLSRYAEVPAGDWRFIAAKHGKPEIASPPGFEWLRFNLSHSGGLVTCAVCRDRDVGVDVEDTERSSATQDIATRFFASTEVAALSALPNVAQRQRFFIYWTLKESYIKARGLGLALPLKKFAFVLDNDGTISISIDQTLGDNPEAWQFHLWRPTRQHQGAAAIRKGVGAVPLHIHTYETIPLIGFEETETFPPPGQT